MAPVTGEPKESQKPKPLGNMPFILLFSACTLCALFILWRRATSLRTVVAHQLQTWTRKDGAIRLSIDDGPSAREFLDDDYDEDHENLRDDEPLALAAERLRLENHAAVDPERLRVLPPVPSPKV